MNRRLNSRGSCFFLALGLLVISTSAILAQTTSFTYQGRLTDSGTPATGNYDLQFVLFDNFAGGTQIGTPQTVPNVAVSAGIFTVQLDFGAAAFPNANRFLEIGVRPAGGGAFTTLAPRQQISSTPYAIRTLSAATADTATNATQLGGLASSQYVQTNDSRLSDARSPTLGSADYIQNTSTQQTSAADFNISGNGTAAGTLKGNVVDATVQYNIAGNRALSIAGTRNTFTGVGAGQANVSGLDNAFFGFNAGLMNNSGARNTYSGVAAGQVNVNGHDSTFFGFNAGLNNTGFGGANAVANFNSFFGANAGRLDTIGGFNSFFGANAGSNSTTGNTNSFFGFSAGSSNAGDDNSFFGVSAGSINKGNRNSFFGVSAGRQSFFGDPDPPFTGDDNAFFGAFAGAHNTASGNSFLGSGAGLANTTGSGNAFFGKSAGSSNTIGNVNAFFGTSAGFSNTEGSANAFFGTSAGSSNTTGSVNAFFGSSAGSSNTTGFYNAFFGPSAGFGNTTGFHNAFFGRSAGTANHTGSDNAFFGDSAGYNTDNVNNSFFGSRAGYSNTNGDDNSFFGQRAGEASMTGESNSFFGSYAGSSNTDGNDNTVIGAFANVGSGSLDHATAIGAGVVVTSSRRVQIGRIGLDTVAIGAFATPTANPISVCVNVEGVFISCTPSSLRYKETVRPLRHGLNLIQRLRPVTFNWKEGHAPDLGLIAEEVAAVEPLLATHNTKGEIEGVRYDRLSLVLINAIKQQQDQIERQKAEAKQQQDQIEALRTANLALHARLRIVEQSLKKKTRPARGRSFNK